LRFAIVVALLFGCNALAGARSAATPNKLSTEGIVACVRLDDAGTVVGAFVIVSSGDVQKDQALLSGVQNLHWGKKKPNETRNIWFPLGLAVGGAHPPNGPANCGSPSS
jgi:hypothetical protein